MWHTLAYPHTLIYITHTKQPHYCVPPLLCPRTTPMGNTWYAYGTVHCTMNPLAMATLSGWASISRLNGRKSLDRIITLRSEHFLTRTFSFDQRPIDSFTTAWVVKSLHVCVFSGLFCHDMGESMRVETISYVLDIAN